jgi:hypothetical protein
MPTLGDGTVIPSHLEIESTPSYSAGDVFSNVRLRFGEVQKVIYPKDADSRTKQFIEYNVYVQERSHGTGNGRLYKHCLLINPLAGLADKAMWTLRGSNSIADKKKNRRGNGSKVLLLCVNGETSNAVIIGGLRNQDDKADIDVSKPQMETVFNGIAFKINDDGEFSLTFNGPTDIDGKLRDDIDKKTVGASITFTKEGKIVVKENQALEIGEATDKFPLFSTYRDAEHNMFQSLQQGITNMATKLTTAAIALNTAGAAVAGPFMAAAAGPQLINASAQLNLAVAELQKMAQSISEFEAKADQYLSKKNKND